MKNEITMDILNKVNAQIGRLFSSYQEKINKAFSEELVISINLPVKIDIDDGSIRVKTGINFIESKVKDESVISIDQNQKQLF